MDLEPFLASPVLMEPASAQFAGYISQNTGSGGVGSFYAPIRYGTDLYQVLGADGTAGLYTPTGGVYVYRSTDNGASWSVLDAANGPSRAHVFGNFSAAFDGGHTITVAYAPTNDPVGGVTGEISLMDFSLVTETWGTAYATTGSGGVLTLQHSFYRPDGSFLVFASPNSGVSITGCTAYVWAAGAWSSFPCDTSVAGTASGNNAACMDSSGRIHLYMIGQHGSGPTISVLYYQAVETSNSLGAFATIQTGTPSLPNLDAPWQPVVSGNSVIIGLSTGTYVTACVGMPLSSPSFTTLGSPGIDPAAPLTGIFRLGACAMAADATGIYAAYLAQSSSDGYYRIRLCGTTDLTGAAGWSQAITAFDDHSIPGTNPLQPSSIQFLGIERLEGSTIASCQGSIVSGSNQPTQFWLGNFAHLTFGNVAGYMVNSHNLF